MSLLSEVLGAVQGIQQDAELNELRFRHSATWSDGTTCRFSVQDPAKDGRSNPQRLSTSPLDASLRRLKVHPDDVMPAPGASTPYQSGLLVRGSQTDISDFTGTSTGVCRLVDARLLAAASELSTRAEAISGVEFDLLLPLLGQSIKVSRPVPVPDGPPPDIEDGVITLPVGQPVHLTDDFPAYGYQVSDKERQQYASLGADIGIPLWRVLIDRRADLNKPGFSLTLSGDKLTAPVPLKPVGDAELVGAAGVVWRLICQAVGQR
ncbi:hypothetical protein [Deinococcus alpinitundrae]|uniref:hypothetical protein n=1 Tax=Deinococcus alpinitundrae TaxID=468913 RepID=UPI00137A879A|nr:hypothetical protein [Deinococcus alpinitundrae]